MLRHEVSIDFAISIEKERSSLLNLLGLIAREPDAPTQHPARDRIDAHYASRTTGGRGRIIGIFSLG